MKTYWHIRPIDDGCTYLIKVGNEHRLKRKGEEPLDLTILFNTAEEANEYISTHLDNKIYIPEWIMISDDYFKEHNVKYSLDEVCPICGTYEPDDNVCNECLKEHNLYKPKVTYIE
jgi:hypothetical protein